MATATLIDFLEAGVEDIAQSISDTIDLCVDAIAPDGRMFGTEKQTPDEEIANYIENFRGNPDAYLNGMRQLVVKIQGAVPPDKAQSVHPYDIAEAVFTEYSARLEEMIQKRGILGKDAENWQALSPLLPSFAPGDEGTTDVRTS